MRKYLMPVLAGALLAALPATVKADFMEGFENATWNTGNQGAGGLVNLGSGQWYVRNRSSSLGTNAVFAGSAATFAPFEGLSYAGMNYQNGGSPTTTIISTWLLTPELTINNGDTLSFWTRTADATQWPDRLEVRLSTNAGSVDVGTGTGATGANAVGDFSSLLLSVNPTLQIGGAYPESWTQYTIVVSGLGSEVQGRFAFRYFVPNAGPNGSNSNYIGIDGVQFAQVPAPAAAALLGLAGMVGPRRRRRA